jgi:hypothetical protein
MNSGQIFGYLIFMLIQTLDLGTGEFSAPGPGFRMF